MGNQDSTNSRPAAGARRRAYRLRRRQYAMSATLSSPEATSGGDSAASAELESKLQSMEAELKHAQELALRNRADMENQRRRHQREKEDLRKFATEELMRSLLSPLDHFELALQSARSAADMDSVRQGVEMIHREFLMVLQGSGLELVRPGQIPFDPALHEAVATDENPDIADGCVTEVLRLGWSLNGRVLRPAMVKVNRLVPGSQDTSSQAAE